MERTAFALLHDMEKSWWYQGRAAAIRSALGTLSPVAQALDYGAGFGGMRAALGDFAKSVDAFEPDAEALASARRRGYTVGTNDASSLPNNYGLIGLFDVLEHERDDRALLQLLHRMLGSGGRLIVTVPAFPFLWSVHDVQHHHFRRYTRRALKTLLAEEGFEAEFASYWNTTLFVPAALMRLLGRSGESGLALPRALDRLFFAIVRIESFVMRVVPLPFGTGLVVRARKKEKSAA